MGPSPDLMKVMPSSEGFEEKVPPTPDGTARVLLVDDDPLVRRLVGCRLDAVGFRIKTADSADAAVATVAAESPDAVLLDLHLGSGSRDGLGCLARLRAAGFLGPVIVLSGDTSNEAAHAAICAGADGFLVKRDFDEIENELRVALRETGRTATKRELPDAARRYLATRGLTSWELQLIEAYAATNEREKALAARLGRSESAVRKMFQEIRGKLGVSNQNELAQLLGVLSCMGGRAMP